MKAIVYRNYDRFAIKHLLIDIGAHAMRLECDGRKQSFPKRLSLFFLEANDDCTYLKYDYPSQGIRAIMKVDRWELPETGWVRVKLR
ncbi:MAG: hypothetical protein AB3N14_05955 [Flavobacteriaceae bacterium]